MSEETTTPDLVELVRLSIAAANRRDVDAILSFVAPNVVADFSQRGVGTFEGSAAFRGFLDDWMGSFDDFLVELEEIGALGNGVVLAVVSQQARPVGVAGHVHTREGWVYSFSADGKIVRLSTSGDIDEARAAAERLAQERG
jgi:ketosteroid isomerase-like protein